LQCKLAAQSQSSLNFSLLTMSCCLRKIDPSDLACRAVARAWMSPTDARQTF
jgi:hypothetical protein